jgi:ectoine hydroxylase
MSDAETGSQGRPMLLTPADEEHYWQDGYLIKDAILGESELVDLRDALEATHETILAEARATQKRQVIDGTVAFSVIEELGIRNMVWEGPDLSQVKVAEPITQVDRRLAKLWEHPNLVALAKFALGTDEVAPFTDKFNTKRAHTGGEFLWHQDHPFWYSILRKQARDTVTIGLFVDDATEANGALIVVPGTQHGPLPRRLGEQDVMLRYHADEAGFESGAATVAEVPAGGGLVFGPFLVHRSGANTTGGDRRVLLLTFQPAGRLRLAEFDYEPALMSEQWMSELP